MKTWIVLLMIGFIGHFSIGQENDGKPDFEQETMDFMAVLNAGDSTGIRSFFYEDAEVFHVEEGVMEGMTIEEFMTVAKKFESGQFQENFLNVAVTDYNNGLVYTDVTFHFFIDGEMAFTGVDHCVWLNKGEGYKIERLYSSVLKPVVQLNPNANLEEAAINLLMDEWHASAAVANFGGYFGFMAEDFIFLGTDPSERWTKVQFSEYCKPHFDAGNGWAFTKNWRNIYFNEDKTMAWFEESLATHMDECRGSGVLRKDKDGWKIVHYNLTVLIENEKMKKFLKLRRKK